MNMLDAIQEEEKAIDKLIAIDARDPEKAHGEADQTLLEFLRETGFEELASAYEDVYSRAPWWGAG